MIPPLPEPDAEPEWVDSLVGETDDDEAPEEESPERSWLEARQAWLEADPDRFDLDRDLDRDAPLGVGSSKVDQLPSAVRLLPDVHRDGEVTALHIARVRGREAVVFEHSWTIGLVQAALKVRSVVAAVEVGPWPPIQIRPRKGLVRRPRRGEFRLEDDRFSRRFVVDTTDPDFAILLLGPELQAWLADGPRARWRVSPGVLAMVRPGRLRAADDDVEASTNALETFIEHIPPELSGWSG